MYKTIPIILFCLFVSVNLFASDYVSHRLDGSSLQLTTTDGKVQLTALHSKAIEVLHQSDKAQLPSFAKAENIEIYSGLIELADSGEFLELSTPDLRVVIKKKPLTLSFYREQQLLVEEEIGYFSHRTTQGFRFKLTKDEQLMGGGERVLGMNRRGHRLPLYNRAHYGYGTESQQMNFSIPAVMSDKKYTLLFDNSAKGWMDLGKTQADILQFEATGGRSAYIVFSGETYPELLKSYIDVTGKQPLPPRWALGNHASRFGYRDQKQVLETIKLYRQLDIPVDSIILDLYWFGADVKGHMGNLDWDKATFPEPIKMINTLKELGVNTVLITEPFILTSSKRWQEAVDHDALGTTLDGSSPYKFDFFFGNTGLVDVFSASGQQWFGNVYKELAKQGVSGVWGDLGEPEVHPSDMLHKVAEANDMIATGDEVHNVYGHQWAKLVQSSLNELNPNQRPFMIMRSGFAGSQRYGMLPWTGDVSRSWDGLKPQVELSLQMGLLGMAYTHSDLGGFAGGDSFDKEMYIRWLQFGVFQPIYRPHAQDNIAPEPVFHDEETIRIIREYIKLRYRLLPYNYSLAYQNSTEGLPFMRPMLFADETNPKWLNMDDQFLWGESFLVKPVTDPGLRSIDVTLPSGNWFDYWTDRIYKGGQVIGYPLELETIPVLVKGGSIIPSVAAAESTASYSSESLQLDFYYDPSVTSSSFVMYEDDGVSASCLETGAYEKLHFESQVLENKPNAFEFKLRSEKGSDGYAGLPNKRLISLVIHNWSSQKNRVSLKHQNGNPAAKIDTEYDSAKRQLIIQFPWTMKEQIIRVAPMK